MRLSSQKIEELGGKLLAAFEKANGYSGRLSKDGEFVLYLNEALSPQETRDLAKRVDDFKPGLKCRTEVTGRPGLE